MAHRLGITGWFDARVDEGLLQAYAAARDAGTLKLHVSAGLLATPRHDPAARLPVFRLETRYEGDTLHVHTVKIFIDGVTESRTAALLEPYPGTQEHGLALWEQDALNQIVALADAAGFDLHFHTLADRAVRMALDALEWAAKCNGPRDRRAQLAHLQLVHPDDMPRFSPLGAIASVQALWTAASPQLQALYQEILGPNGRRKAIRCACATQAHAGRWFWTGRFPPWTRWPSCRPVSPTCHRSPGGRGLEPGRAAGPASDAAGIP
jgi:predicted amidohydrolase YtcJ